MYFKNLKVPKFTGGKLWIFGGLGLLAAANSLRVCPRGSTSASRGLNTGITGLGVLVHTPSSGFTISRTCCSALESEFDRIDLDELTSEKAFHLFQMWKKEMGREYQTLEEEAQRFQIFERNLKKCKEENAERRSPNDCYLGLNNFSDMSFEEFSKMYLNEQQ